MIEKARFKYKKGLNSMDLWKLKVYLEVLAIACNLVGAPYVILLAVLGIEPLQPIDMIYAFTIFMMVKYNDTWNELWEKWTGK
jgi:hypothetical protein